MDAKHAGTVHSHSLRFNPLPALRCKPVSPEPTTVQVAAHIGGAGGAPGCIRASVVCTRCASRLSPLKPGVLRRGSRNGRMDAASVTVDLLRRTGDEDAARRSAPPTPARKATAVARSSCVSVVASVCRWHAGPLSAPGTSATNLRACAQPPVQLLPPLPPAGTRRHLHGRRKTGRQ